MDSKLCSWHESTRKLIYKKVAVYGHRPVDWYYLPIFDPPRQMEWVVSLQGHTYSWLLVFYNWHRESETLLRVANLLSLIKKTRQTKR